MIDKTIEKSIIKKFRKEIFSKFVKAIKDYELIKDNDRILVCISGGKDSFLLALCLRELQKHKLVKFDLEYAVMNPGYSPENIDKLKENLDKLDIAADIFQANIFEFINQDTIKNPCYLCARMRRGHLYNRAKELKCNKIALGHHFDDVIETVMLNMFYNGSFSSMLPILKSDNFEGLELIRPLYYVREKDINRWKNYNDLKFLDCACKIAEKKIGSRLYIKNIIKDLEKSNPDIAKSIFKSTINVNLNTLLTNMKDKE